MPPDIESRSRQRAYSGSRPTARADATSNSKALHHRRSFARRRHGRRRRAAARRRLRGFLSPPGCTPMKTWRASGRCVIRLRLTVCDER
jgi:hypothetical protein